MKDLSDKSRLDEKLTAAPKKEHGRLHRWRWKFKCFMYDWGFKSFLPPKPRNAYYFGPKFKISESELRNCPPDKTYEQYEMELREKAYNEAIENWRNGEEYAVGDISLMEDIKYHVEAFVDVFKHSKSIELKILFLLLALAIFIVIAGNIGFFIYAVVKMCMPLDMPHYESPFGN